MATGGDNPFRQALDATRPSQKDLQGTQAAGALDEKGNPVQRDQGRTIEDLKLVDPRVLAKNPKVARLTVRDLNDLAAQFSGLPTRNQRIGELTVEDMQDIEGIFLEYKVNTARVIAERGLENFAVDVSCCCTTPCCCCAAADLDPIQA